MSTQESLFNKYWIEILRRNGEYFLRYDDGRSISSMVEAPLTSEEANRALHELQGTLEEQQLALLSALVHTVEERKLPSSPTILDRS